jgi:hypothetical protein
VTDRELIKLAKEFRRGILGNRDNSKGWCAAISWPLESLLSLHGIEAALVETNLSSDSRSSEALNHVWLMLPDGRALDPTADQFDRTLGEVYLGSPLWFHGVTR